MDRFELGELGRILAAGSSWAGRHLGTSPLTRRQRYIGLGAAAGLAGLLVLGATLPAGAKSEFVISAGGATVTIPQVRIKAGPVTFTGSAQPALPRFVSNVGHFTIGQAQDRQAASNIVYGCPPYFAGGYASGYSYGGLAYGGAGYGVPLYDYRARGTYDRSYVRNDQRRLFAQQQRPREETLGTFNLPSGYTVTGLIETPRPSFQPRIVQLAGAPQHSGPMPVVHKPAGKNHIHIE